MTEQGGALTERPTYGCMECKAQQPYTVEQFPNGNPGWRCVECGHILRLSPGKDSEIDGLAPAAVEASA